MCCPECQGKQSTIIETRQVKDEDGNDYIRRRRECCNKKCRSRWTTYESFEMADPELCLRAADAQKQIDEVSKLLAQTRKLLAPST